jgi:hypothetical protein
VTPAAALDVDIITAPVSLITFMLETNEDLLEAVVECQRLGRVQDAVA